MSIRSAAPAATAARPPGPTRFEQVLNVGIAYPRTVLEPWVRQYPSRETKPDATPATPATPTKPGKPAKAAKPATKPAGNPTKPATKPAGKPTKPATKPAGKPTKPATKQPQTEDPTKLADEQAQGEADALAELAKDNEIQRVNGRPLGRDGLPERGGLETTTVAHFHLGSEV